MALSNTIIYTVYAISIILTPIKVCVLGLLWIYRRIIYVYCKYKYGESFGGLLYGGDIAWVNEDSSRNLISVLMLISSKNADPEIIRKLIIQRLKLKMKDQGYTKLHSIRRNVLGYTCVIKNQYTPEEAVKILKLDSTKSSINRDELEDLVSEFTNKPLPKNNKCFYHVWVSSLPTRLDDNGIKQYPILCRFHHTLADGPSIILHLGKALGFKFPQPLKLPTQKEENKVFNFIIKLLRNLCCLIVSSGQALTEQVLHADEECLLHGKTLTGHKISIWQVEKEPFLIDTIKKIKQTRPECAFGDFLMCTLSKTLEDYFQQKSESPPYDMTAILPIPSPERELKLNNTFTVGFYKLPVKITNAFNTRLQEVMSRSKLLRNSPSLLVNHWLMKNNMSLTPLPILRLLSSSKFTLGISNLPGPNKVIHPDYTIEEAVFWVPNRGKTGICISFFSYDGRLQISLNVDKALISSKEDARLLLEGIFKNLRTMCKQNLE